MSHASLRYLVFARREYSESLTVVGVLEAASGDDPGEQARARFGADWLELVLAPEHAVHWVLQEGAGAEVTA
jgi:hypothetical protein